MNAEKMDNLWEKYIAIADIAEYQKKYLKTLGKLLMQEISFLYKIYAYVLEEHEEEINNFPEKHRIGETMKMINKEFDLKVSYTGCRSLMKQAKANKNQTVENQTIENTEEA